MYIKIHKDIGLNKRRFTWRNDFDTRFKTNKIKDQTYGWLSRSPKCLIIFNN